MNVTFSNGKANNCYEAFVTNPLDRQALKKFCKLYSMDIADEAVNLHNRITKFPSASACNAVYGSTKNRIEKKEGVKDKDPFIMKVRVTSAYRKFFNILLDAEVGTLLKTKEWIG